MTVREEEIGGEKSAVREAGAVLEAGRELDALIAERVIGHVWDPMRCRVCGWPLKVSGEPGGHCNEGGCSMRPVPQRRADEARPYSTDIAAAFDIVEELSPARWLGLSEYRDGWRAIFSSTEGRAPLHAKAEAETAPLAICRAALAAIEARSTPTEAGDEPASVLGGR